MDQTIIDHERRLTRLEDRFEVNLQALSARLDKVEKQASAVEAHAERIRDLAKKIEELEKAQPTQAATIGLDPNGA